MMHGFEEGEMKMLNEFMEIVLSERGFWGIER
jgi:hypothetical protein